MGSEIDFSKFLDFFFVTNFVKIIKSSVIYEQNLMNFCCKFFNLKFLNAKPPSLKIFMISMAGSAFTTA